MFRVAGILTVTQARSGQAPGYGGVLGSILGRMCTEGLVFFIEGVGSVSLVGSLFCHPVALLEISGPGGGG